MRIGFVGIGTMGLPIAKHILNAKNDMVVFDAFKQASQPLLDEGAELAKTPGDVASKVEVVFLSLPGPAEIKQVVLGSDGILANAAPGTIVIDLSTNSVEGICHIADRCAQEHVIFVDAPVSGGVVGAQKGTLSVMVGSDADVFQKIQPLLDTFSETAFHVGLRGSGALAKLVNNQIFLCTSVLIQEGLVMAAKAGMNSNDLLKIVNASSGGLYTRNAGFVLSRDFDNAMFKLNIAHKDVAVALESAAALGVDMPTTAAALGVYQDALDMGLADKNFSSTLQALEAKAEVEVAALETR